MWWQINSLVIVTDMETFFIMEIFHLDFHNNDFKDRYKKPRFNKMCLMQFIWRASVNLPWGNPYATKIFSLTHVRVAWKGEMCLHLVI